MEHHFFAYINRMKLIQRWGLMRNTMPENDMEHALQAAMVAHAMAILGNVRYQRTYNAEYVMALAMYHDACEVITGDLPTPIKHHNPAIKSEYGKLEAMAAEKLLTMLPEDVRVAYRPLIDHDETTPEWRLVKAAEPHMRANGWGRICCITSAAVKQPIPFLSLSNLSRAARSNARP